MIFNKNAINGVKVIKDRKKEMNRKTNTIMKKKKVYFISV